MLLKMQLLKLLVERNFDVEQLFKVRAISRAIIVLLGSR